MHTTSHRWGLIIFILHLIRLTNMRSQFQLIRRAGMSTPSIVSMLSPQTKMIPSSVKSQANK